MFLADLLVALLACGAPIAGWFGIDLAVNNKSEHSVTYHAPEGRLQATPERSESVVGTFDFGPLRYPDMKAKPGRHYPTGSAQ